MVIINFHRISDLIPADRHGELDKLATMHLRNSNIEFKVVGLNGNEISIRTTQGKHLSENYADEATLRTRTKELFQRFLPDHIIYTHAIPYREAIVEIVTPEWVNVQMLKKKIRIKDISVDTGIDKSNLSAWINGVRPMSQPVKAMFYFYFISK